MSTEQDLAAVKKATRELHEQLQECKDVQAAMKATTEELRGVIKEYGGDLEGVLADVAQEVLAQFHVQVTKAISDATDAVYRQFDQIAQILLGSEQRGTRNNRKPSLLALAKEKAGQG